jgi:hypothetical protein
VRGAAILVILAAAAALAGCAGTNPGIGWSRAPDLSVYASMNSFARTAIDQERLCAGFDEASTARHWERDFGARQAAVAGALTRRYGAEALVRTRTAYAPAVPCGDVPDPQWRGRYARLLRLLEIRFGLVPGREG